MKRFTALFASAFVVLSLLAAPHAWADDHNDAPKDDNSAIAVNTKDGSSIFKLAFSIVKVSGDVVDATNTAIAYASCTECQTTAIAIQFVIVEGSPSTFTPQNVAVAVNENCNLCNTLASAYQFVIQTSGPVRLTHEGWFQLWRIRKELLDLKNSGLSPPEMQARIDFLAKQAYQVVSTSLVPADKNQNDAQRDHQDEATTTTSSAVERSTSTSTSTTSPSTSSTSTSTSTTSTSTP